MTLNRDCPIVVGVLPREYVGPLAGDEADVCIPLYLQPQFLSNVSLSSPGDYWLHVMVWLGPGMTEDQAKASLEVLWCQHPHDHLLEASNVQDSPSTLLPVDGRRGPTIARGFMPGLLPEWMKVRGLLPVIACVNLAGLLPGLLESRINRRTRLGSTRVPRMPRAHMGKAFAVVQIAMSLTLAAGTARLLNPCGRKLGFDPKNLLLCRLNAAQAGYQDHRVVGVCGNARCHVIATGYETRASDQWQRVDPRGDPTCEVRGWNPGGHRLSRHPFTDPRRAKVESSSARKLRSHHAPAKARGPASPA